MRISEAREAVLAKLDSFSLQELRKPGSSELYEPHHILMMVVRRLPAPEENYIRNANSVVRASFEAAVDRSIRDREAELLRRSRRRRR